MPIVNRRTNKIFDDSSADRQSDTVVPTSHPINMDVSSVDSTISEAIAKVALQRPDHPWTITYYDQVLGEDDVPKTLDTHLSPTLQTYDRINDILLNVESTLSGSPNADGRYTISGTGVLPKYIRSNVGNVFTAAVAPGQPPGIFYITNVTPTSYLPDSPLRVDYVLEGWVNDPDMATIVNHLEEKTVSENSYSTDTGEVVGVEDAEVNDTLAEDIVDLERGYVRMFVDEDTEILNMPTGSTIRAFDGNVAKFAGRAFSTHFDNYRRAKRTIFDTLFDNDDRWFNPIHTFMRLDRVAERGYVNHLVHTNIDLDVNSITPKPTKADYPFSAAMIEALAPTTTVIEDTDDTADADAADAEYGLGMVIHRTLEGIHDIVDIQRARTAGRMYPRIIREIIYGTFDNITIAGINEDLESNLFIYVLRNGVVVHSTVLNKDNYPNGVPTRIDYPLGAAYTSTPAERYRIEITHPDPFRGTFIFGEIYPSLNNGDINNYPPVVQIEMGNWHNVVGDPSTDLEVTDVSALITTGTPVPSIYNIVTTGEMDSVRIRATNNSYTGELTLTVVQNGVTLLNTAIDPSSYSSGIYSTVVYNLPSTINADDGAINITISDITDDTTADGELLFESIIPGVSYDLGPIPAPSYVPGMEPAKPAVIGVVTHLDDEGEEVSTTLPDVRLSGDEAPKVTVTVIDGDVDVIRIGLANYDLHKPITLKAVYQGNEVLNTELNDADYLPGTITYIDYPVIDMDITATDTLVITMESTDGTGDVGEVLLKELVVGLVSELGGTPASSSITYDSEPVIVSSVTQLDTIGNVEDTAVHNYRGYGDPNVLTVNVIAGEIDTIRIRAANLEADQDLELVVTHHGVAQTYPLLRTTYPVGVMQSIDYTLTDTIHVYDPDVLTIQVRHTNTITDGKWVLHSINAGVLANFGTLPGAVLLPVRDLNAACKYMYDDWTPWVTAKLSIPYNRCDEDLGKVYTVPTVTGDTTLDGLVPNAPIDDTTTPEVDPIDTVMAGMGLFSPTLVEDFPVAPGFTGPVYNSVSFKRYIFSDSFYNLMKPTCLLEQAILDYLDKKPVSLPVLVKLFEEYKYQRDIEKYYYGPIITYLAKRYLIEGKGNKRIAMFRDDKQLDSNI